MAPNTFHIRPATVAAEDHIRMLAFFDSQLTWLASKGSEGQWGTESRSTDEYKAKYRDKISRGEAQRDKSFSRDWIWTDILEAEVEADSLSAEFRELAGETAEVGTVRVPVAALMLDGKAAEYVHSVLPEQDEKEPFVYLSYLLSDRRTGEISKGAGSFLIEHAKSVVKELGIKRICLDCWRGNGEKLVK